ncbi:MAG: site-2 protease family protein [Candidatus Eisenbacteria bacterium]|nr:site-2 protease family protein [Candidatus Eisenbacteria bacterium]
MKWSWKVGTYAGIGVFIHVTFFLLLGWLALSYWAASRSLVAVASGVGFFLLLFLSVVLHEYGHALTARRYGIRTRDIILLPIGGVARLERIPEDPRQELWVALAGPAVNVGIAALLGFALFATGGWEPWSGIGTTRGPFLERLLFVNVFLVLFNMIPAFPMDGGRVLRALLAMRMEYTRATQTAASIGQALALVFGFVGLFTNPFLILIALFVWLGASQEASMVQMKSALHGIPVRRVMLTDFRTLSAGDSLALAIEATIAGSQKDFPVVENGRISGILTQDGLFKALAERGKETPVSEVMDRSFQTAHPSDLMQSVFLRLQECRCHSLPIVQGETLVGLLTMENLGEFLGIQTALAR